MSDQGILQAEHRVREMNRMTQQYAEQGNRYMQNMTAHPPRFVPMHTGSGQDAAIADAPVSRQTAAGQMSSPVQPVHNHNINEQSKDPLDTGDDRHPEAHQTSRHSSTQKQGLASFGIENDKLLIIALIYILIKENADIKLILALGYLLL